MRVKERILAIIENIDFQEYIEEKSTCPECKRKSLIRHIRKEKQQSWRGRWFVEYCTDEGCEHWDCGFLTGRYKPRPDKEYRVISDQPTNKSSEGRRNE